MQEEETQAVNGEFLSGKYGIVNYLFKGEETLTTFNNSRPVIGVHNQENQKTR